MARTTRYVGGEAALAALLAAAAVGLVGACASMQTPPGGPPDPDPPILVTVAPDSGAEMPEFDDDVEFQFDEIVAELNLETLVRVSPRHDEVRVSWKRSRLTVKPRDGWHQDVVYIVTLLPGVTDLSNNRTDSTHTVVFSTGGPIPDTRIFGSVVDWERGEVAPGALIEAMLLPDSLTYVGIADSIGDFEMAFLPIGTYHLRAAIDGNNNQRVDSREAYDSATIDLASSFLIHEFWAFRHDTIGPRITSVTRADSQSIIVAFDQALALAPIGPEAFAVWELPDSTPIGVDQVLRRAVYDSLQAEAREAARIIADSIAAIVADSIAAAVRDSLAEFAPDSAAAIDSLVPAAAPAPDTIAIAELEPDTTTVEEAVPDSTRAMRMLAERPELISEVVLVITGTLQPDTRYWIQGTASNLLGAIFESGRFLVVPAAVEPDST